MESLRISGIKHCTIRKVMCTALLLTLSCSRDHEGGKKQGTQNDTTITPHQSNEYKNDQYSTADSIRQANNVVTETFPTTSKSEEKKAKRQKRLQEIGDNIENMKKNIAQAINGTVVLDTSSH